VNDGVLGQLLERRIEARTAKLAIVGLGSVGLPLAKAFVEAGFDVLGYDVDALKTAQLERGLNTLHHLAAGFARDLVASGRFHATTDPERLTDVDIAIVCVPTPLDSERKPDLSCIVDSSVVLAAHMKRHTLVVLESTTWPGTTRRVVGDAFRARGFTPGVDVFLAFSPEREDPGRNLPTAALPKLVGGTCVRSKSLATSLYAQAIEVVVPVSSAEVAEAAKLLENVFRAVNIALVNELKVAFQALGIDVWEVIDAASTKPFGFMRFTPGPGLGGHCLPIDPFYLSWIAREHGAATRLVELAGEISRDMPRLVVERASLALTERGTAVRDAQILILGLAYKPEVDIVTESPSIRLIELFEEAGAFCTYSDPYVPIAPLLAGHAIGRRESLALSDERIAAFDLVLVATDHKAFDWDAIARSARLVVDTRNALATRLEGQPHYVKA